MGTCGVDFRMRYGLTKKSRYNNLDDGNLSYVQRHNKYSERRTMNLFYPLPPFVVPNKCSRNLCRLCAIVAQRVILKRHAILICRSIKQLLFHVRMFVCLHATLQSFMSIFPTSRWIVNKSLDLYYIIHCLHAFNWLLYAVLLASQHYS